MKGWEKRYHPAVCVSAMYLPPFNSPGWNVIVVEPGTAPDSVPLHVSHTKLIPEIKARCTTCK